MHGQAHKAMVSRRWAGLVAVGIAGALVTGGCRPAPPEGGNRGGQKPAADTWTPERISQEPEAYLVHVDAAIQQRVADRQTSLKSIKTRRADLEARYAPVEAKCGELENLHKRLKSAYRRAEDEDRWPFVLAGRQFDRAKADAVMGAIQQGLAQNRPLVAAYQDALRRLGVAEQTLTTDLDTLGQLRAKVDLDRERLRINKGMAELSELQKREAELASFSQVLVDMGDDLDSGVLSVSDAAQRAKDMDNLLK